MKETSEIFAKGLFFFIVGTVLLTMFIWALVQGVTGHPNDPVLSALYYLAAILSGVGGVVLYHQAKYTMHYAKIAA
jgi:hypothetical protein